MRFWGLYNRNLRQLDLFKVFSFLLVLTNLFLVITVINTSKNSKIIITPPYITSEFEMWEMHLAIAITNKLVFI